MICDTDIGVIRIWWLERFGELPGELAADTEAERSGRAYLLLEPDIPWQPDPQRENPQDRPRLLARHREALEHSGHPWAAVRGEGAERVQCALEAARRVLDAVDRAAELNR